jgi:hypothetical protein
MKQSIWWKRELVGEREVIGENMPQCQFYHNKPHTNLSQIEPKDSEESFKLQHGQARVAGTIGTRSDW